MTRTDARQLADTIAKDLVRLAPLATRYAVLRQVDADTYHVVARVGEEYVLCDSPEVWTAQVDAMQRAECLAQQEHERRRRQAEHWVPRAVAMVLAFVGALVGFAWLYASSPLLRWVCFVLFADEPGWRR